MHDYILELSSFFRTETLLLDATRELKMTIEVLKALKSTPGKSMDQADECLKVAEFKGVPLHFSKEHINRLQFDLEALIDSLSSLNY